MGLDLNINLSEAVAEKLRQKHSVTQMEVRQCFINRDGGLLEDTRDDHKTDPSTEWFIAETNKGRRLKICFVQVGSEIDVKTAYEPNDEEISIYDAKAY